MPQRPEAVTKCVAIVRESSRIRHDPVETFVDGTMESSKQRWLERHVGQPMSLLRSICSAGFETKSTHERNQSDAA
jgi:hypothetical protein